MTESIDLTDTIQPRSDQLNADDFIAHPMTFTVAEVTRGSAEQPIELHTAEMPGRPYKPSKSMRRVLVAAWGSQGAAYVGRSMTLYRDETVKFGGEQVGGIKISHLSHIDKPMTIALTTTRGKKGRHHVDVLPDAAPVRDWAAEVAACTTEDELKAIWEESKHMPIVGPLVTARLTELRAETEATA